MRDLRGNEIEVGAVVAYNLSGTIAIGRIVKIVPRVGWRGEEAWTFHIDPLKAHFELKIRPGVSKVTRPENLLVMP